VGILQAVGILPRLALMPPKMCRNSLAPAAEPADITELVPRSLQSTGLMLPECEVHRASNI